MRLFSHPERNVRPFAGPEYQTWTFVFLVCAVVFTITGWRFWCDYNLAFAEATVDTANMARSLADHADATFKAADIVLTDVAERAAEDGLSGPALGRLHQHILAQVAAVPAIHHLVVFSEQGDAQTASFDPTPPMNIADRPHFQFHRDHATLEPLVGQPVRNRVDGHWSLTLSRRFDHPDGTFGGIAVAVIDAETFSEFYAKFDLRAHGSITLLNAEDRVVVRYPPPADADYRDKPGRQRFWQRGDVGEGRFISQSGNIARTYSFRRAGHVPLVVVVTLSERDIVKEWRHDALVALLVCACVSVALGLLGWLLVSQIRHREQREASLRRSEARYRLLAEHSMDVIIQLDARCRATYVSPSSEPVLGYPAQALLDKHPVDMAHPDDTQILQDSLAEIMGCGRAPPVNYRIRNSLGADVWVEVLGSKLECDQSVVLAIRDVTLRKEAEAQLLRAQRMEAVGQLTAGVAHDFNNLLQVQSGALELVLEEIGDNRAATELVTMALEAGERGANLTHSLLSFSRQQILRPEPVSMTKILSQLQTMLSRTLGPQIALQVELAPNTGDPLADPAHLEAALLNLALNARDAMPKGGHLSVTARNATEDIAAPADLLPRPYIVLTVADNGQGMSAETLRRACEPFFTTREIGKGSGLGLSMVQGFAKQSGGVVRIRSALQQGTSIELWLPVAHEAKTETAAVPTDAIQAGRILLVEDVAEIAETMASLLEDQGFSVVLAADAEAALAQLETGALFDVLLTDFAMPGLNGGDLVRMSREIRPELRAIIVTGHVGLAHSNDIPPGVQVLRKPIRNAVLVGHLLALMKAPATREDWQHTDLPAVFSARAAAE